MSLAEYEDEPWPDDVPAPKEAPDDDTEAEFAALEALHREQQRRRGVEQPKPDPCVWTPQNPIALAVWKALPESGRGVDYWRTVHSVAGAGGWDPRHVQAGLLGLVLLERAYVAPATGGGSWAGRGNDPRLGAMTFRTGAMGALGG